MKIWIAYLVPRYDTQSVHEDGIGYMAAGATEAEAIAKIEAEFLESLGGEDNEEYREIRYEENKLHTQEVEV